MRLEGRHRTAVGLFLIGLILLGFWWYELHLMTICELSGGKWERLGSLNSERCNPKTNDWGSACLDSSECQGACLVETLTDKVGFCSEYRYFSGCVNGMYRGNVSGLCWT